MDLRDRQHRLFQRVLAARDHGLQGMHHVGRDDDRIHRGMRLCRVAAHALDHDVPAVARRHRRAGAKAELVHRHARHVVDAEHGITGKAVEQAVLHHGARAGVAAFLGRLEDEHHGAVEVAVRGQVLRRAQQHGGVPVMAAAVHAAADGEPVREAVVLGHGQRVHVGAQAHGLLAAAGAQDADDAGFPQARVDFQAPAAQLSATSVDVRVSWKASSGWAWMSRRSAVSSGCARSISAMVFMAGSSGFRRKK